jgi:tetratricopeptide (TPR) repeat protein/O-antigen ligase
MKLTRQDFLLLGVIIYFTFIGGTFYSQLNFPVRVLNQVVVTVILGGWLAARLWHREGVPATLLDGGILFFLGVNFLSAFLGQSLRFSLENLWFTTTHILAFYLLVDLMRRGHTAKLVWAFYMAGAAVCAVGFTEFAGWYFGTTLFADFALGWFEIGGWHDPLPPLIYRLNITLNGSTPLAAYLALLITPAVGLILSMSRYKQNRQALLVWLVLAVPIEILTFSRAGILALGVSLMLLTIGWYRVSGGWGLHLGALWRGLALPPRLAVLLGSAGGGAAVSLWLYRSFVGRVGSTDFRLTLWEVAFRIIGNNSLIGVGPGNFGRALLRFNDSGLPRQQIATAHNLYLNVAAELGLLGLLALAVLYGLVGLVWWRRWRKAAAKGEQIRLLACGAALVGLAVQCLVDVYLATPNVLLTMALVAYLVAGLEPGPKGTRLFPAYIGLVMLGGYGVGWYRVALADFHYQNSFTAGDLPRAINEAALAVEYDPGLALRAFRLGLLEARLAAQSEDPALLEAAVAHYRAGLEQEPILGLNSANLAGLLWRQGEREAAIDLLRRTAASELNPLYEVNLGYFYEQAGARPQADAAYTQALRYRPALAGSGFWQALPERTAIIPEVVANGSPQVAVEIALARQNFEQAEALLAGAPQSQLKAQRIELYLEQGRPELARPLLPPSPQSRRDYLGWGRLKWLEQDEVAAEKLLKTAAFLGERQAYFYLGRLFEKQGRLPEAERAYRRAFGPHALAEDKEVALYGRYGGNDLAPPLIRIGVGPREAAPWLALADLYERQGRFTEARQIYITLLNEDSFLISVPNKLKQLEGKIPTEKN